MIPEPSTPHRYLCRRDAAAYLGLSPSFLAKAAIKGDGPEFVKIGRRVLYERESLDMFATNHRRRSTSDSRLRSSTSVRRRRLLLDAAPP